MNRQGTYRLRNMALKWRGCTKGSYKKFDVEREKWLCRTHLLWDICRSNPEGLGSEYLMVQ